MKFSKKQPIIIKIGSAVLCDEQGHIDESIISHLCDNFIALANEGYKVVVVSSGAIGAGLQVIETSKKVKLHKKQALAAIGQVRLMQLYQKYLGKGGLSIGQVLLSHEDFKHRKSFLNTRATLTQLLQLKVIPIINENDTVSTEEIQFGDNDRMSVLIANAIESDQVIFLSTIAGLMDFDRENQKIDDVDVIDQRIFSLAKGGNSMGSGGMGSKLMSIDALNQAGKTAWLADGKQKNTLVDLVNGKKVGTCFHARKEKKNSKEQWMLQHLNPHGAVYVDEGAKKALSRKRASLLTKGITYFEGQWQEGQLLSVYFEGGEFCRGMARLSSEKLQDILNQDKSLLEQQEKGELAKYIIHRDDLAFIENQA